MSASSLVGKVRVWDSPQIPAERQQPITGTRAFRRNTHERTRTTTHTGSALPALPAHRSHEAGLPYLPTDDLSPRQVQEWIDYLRVVIAAHEQVQALLHETACRLKEPDSPYLLTPPREELPASYRPPWQDLPDAFDHDHIIGSIKREDGLVESVCVLCGISA